MGGLISTCRKFRQIGEYMNEYIRLMEKSEQAIKNGLESKSVDLQIFCLKVAKYFEEKARALLVGEVC
jgi:hypothetical protein